MKILSYLRIVKGYKAFCKTHYGGFFPQQVAEEDGNPRGLTSIKLSFHAVRNRPETNFGYLETIIF